MTALDLITKTMILIGVLAQGETPSNDEAVDILDRLNEMLDRWQTERLSVYTITAALYNLTNAKGAYQIGPGAADFNTARPVLIQSANYVQPGTLLRWPLDILTAVQWAAIPERNRSAQLPRSLYPDYAFPVMNLNLDPVPNAGGQMELFTWTAVAQLPLLTTVVSFPPAFLEAIQYDLGVRIAPSFGRTVDPAVIQGAVNSKAALQKFTSQLLLPSYGETPPAIGSPTPPEGIQPPAAAPGPAQ
jgi:hypothetical protein